MKKKLKTYKTKSSKEKKKKKFLKDLSKSSIQGQVRADRYNDKETINETEIDNFINFLSYLLFFQIFL